MNVTDSYEVLESVVVEMDLVVYDFAGVVAELVFDGDLHRTWVRWWVSSTKELA